MLIQTKLFLLQVVLALLINHLTSNTFAIWLSISVRIEPDLNVSASLKPNCTKQACIITSYSYKLTVINVVVAIVGERSQIRDDVIFDVGLLKVNVIKLSFNLCYRCCGKIRSSMRRSKTVLSPSPSVSITWFDPRKPFQHGPRVLGSALKVLYSRIPYHAGKDW